MSHRQADISELCCECRAPTRTFCPRCGTPLCAEHLPESLEKRCAECESTYLNRRQEQKRQRERGVTSGLLRLAVFVLVAVGSLIGLALLLPESGLWLGPILEVMLVAVLYLKVPPLLDGWRESIARPKFLAKTPQMLLRKPDERPALPSADRGTGRDGE